METVKRGELEWLAQVRNVVAVVLGVTLGSGCLLGIGRGVVVGCGIDVIAGENEGVESFVWTETVGPQRRATLPNSDRRLVVRNEE